MKRILLSITGTVAALVALLSFKSHGTVGLATSLPSAALPQSGTSSSAPPGASSSAGAPPASTRSTASSPSSSAPSAAAAARSVIGSAEQTRYGVVQVKVTVSGKKITDVAFVQLTAYDGRSQMINQSAAPVLLQQTLAAQSAQIDGVSGATYTSAGYEASLQSALDQL